MNREKCFEWSWQMLLWRKPLFLWGIHGSTCVPLATCQKGPVRFSAGSTWVINNRLEPEDIRTRVKCQVCRRVDLHWNVELLTLKRGVTWGCDSALVDTLFTRSFNRSLYLHLERFPYRILICIPLQTYLCILLRKLISVICRINQKSCHGRTQADFTELCSTI